MTNYGCQTASSTASICFLIAGLCMAGVSGVNAILMIIDFNVTYALVCLFSLIACIGFVKISDWT